MRVVLAPDKFKGSLTAAEVANHLATGMRSVRPDIEVVIVPVSDGGDDLDVGAEPEQELERLAEDLVVLDEHDADRRGHSAETRSG